MKKVLSIFLAVVILISGVVFASAKGNDKLQFDENGQFKILALADIQSGFPVGEALKAYITEAIDASNPDLVMFLGDNIMSPEDGTVESYWKGYDEVFPILESKGVPFTFVFGNHDDESAPTVTKEEMLKKYQSYDGCLAYDADPSLHGCATHNLPILSSDGKKVAYNLWMFDSGDYVFYENGKRRGYDCVRADQIEWYKAESAKLKAANGGEVVPSLLFQHVPVKEIYQFVDRVTYKEAENACFNIDDRKWYSLNESSGLIGDDNVMGEAPCSEPLSHTTGQYEAWLEKGDIIGAFFAHDHVNNFMGRTGEGIILGYNGGTGFRAYGRGDHRSMRVFNLNENDIENYETHSIYYCDVVGESFSYYVSDFMTPAIFGDIFRAFLKMFFII